MTLKIKIISLGLLSLVLFPFIPLQAATLTYPDVAPCNTTLQACINGAAAGDIIQIATNSRISEDLTIAKSLTLEAASGFSPLIGNPSALTPDDISIDDAGAAGGSVDIVFNNLTLNAARIDVTFNENTNHSFELTNSSLSHMVDSNNETGVDLSLYVPSTILLQGNALSTTGQPIQIFTDLTSGNIDASIIGNTITTTEEINSYEGIQFRPRGAGTVTLNVYSNLIYGIGGCNCGSNTGIDIETSDSVAATVNIINNTIDDIQASASGIYVDTPGDTSTLTVNVFNTIISNANGEAFSLPVFSAQLTVNNDFNNFFHNTSIDFGGYSAGSNTLTVDPSYADSSTGQYQLASESSLIDAGTSSPTGDLPAIDADGNTRTSGAAPDIGAYELIVAAALDTPSGDSGSGDSGTAEDSEDTESSTASAGGGCQLSTKAPTKNWAILILFIGLGIVVLRRHQIVPFPDDTDEVEK